MAKSPKKPAAKKPPVVKKPTLKLRWRADKEEDDEPLPELEKMLQEIPRMSRVRKGRLRARLENRLVKHAMKLGLSEEEAKRRIGDGTIIQWFVDHGPQLLAFAKMIMSIITALI